MRILSIALLLACVPALHADDWPQWLGPKRDGVWRETGTLEKFPAGGPKVLWKATTAGIGYAGPAVAGGKVIVPGFALDEGQKFGGAFSRGKTMGQELVTCYDEKTGSQLWQHKYPSEYSISYAAGPRCTPTIDGDRTYTLGAMGDLVCLETATGKPVWAKNFPKDYAAPVPIWGFAAHPLVDGDKLICLVGGDKGKLVVAFDKKTGKELWAALDGSGDFGYCPPVVYDLAGRRQLVIWHSKALAGLDPETGSKLWEIPFEIKAALTAPMPRKVGEDQVFVTSFYNGSMLVRATPTGAEIVWRSKAKGERPDQTTDLSSIMPTPLVKDGHIYGVCSYGQLRAIKADTGERVWETMQATRGRLTPANVKAKEEPSTVSPWPERWSNAFLIEHGDRTVLFNEQGELILAKLTPKGYEEIDRAAILEPTNKMAGRPVVWMHPAFANKCVFARNDNELVCVSLAK